MAGYILLQVLFIVDCQHTLAQALCIRRALQRADAEAIAKQEFFVERSWVVRVSISRRIEAREVAEAYRTFAFAKPRPNHTLSRYHGEP